MGLTQIERDNRFLQEENRRLQMKLSALKTLLMYEHPICAEKLSDLLAQCEGCKEGTDE